MIKRIIRLIYWIITTIYGYVFFFLKPRRNSSRLMKLMKDAQSYREWEAVAQELDQIQGKGRWKSDPVSNHYDYQLISHTLTNLKKVSQTEDYNLLAFVIRSSLLRNLGGIANPKLHSHCSFGTKRLIEDFISEISHDLLKIYNADEQLFTLDQKHNFFLNIHQSYGRSALILNGGSAFGIFHLGVVKALYEQMILPKVIYGNSVGALIASLVCSLSQEELPSVFEKGGINFDAFKSRGQKGRLWRRVRRLFKEGVLMDVKVLEKCVQDNIGNVTFQEAFEKTGRILNISVNIKDTDVPILLNYLTAPNVLIRSAACASCAVVGIYEDVDILSKSTTGQIIKWEQAGQKWSPMTMKHQLPMNRLSELFNVNHFVVSQVIPYVIPIFSNAWWQNDSGVVHLISSEIEHRFRQLVELNLIPNWVKGFSQIYRGDVTVVPDVTLQDYISVYKHPTDDFIQYCILKGEGATWPKLSSLKTRLTVEMNLDILFEKIKVESDQRSKNRKPRNFKRPEMRRSSIE